MRFERNENLLMRKPLTFELLEKPDGFDAFSFAEFSYNGQRASAEPEYRPRPYAPNTFYSKAHAERNVLLTGLLLSDVYPVEVWKREKPDFLVSLGQNERVFVETTLAAPQSRLHMTETTLQIHAAIKEWLKTQPHVELKLIGRDLIFVLGDRTSKSNIDLAVSEIKKFILDETFDSYPDVLNGNPVGDGYPVLRGLKCYIARPTPSERSPIFSVSSRVELTTFSHEARPIFDSIQRKRKVAKEWGVEPLWLITYVAHSFWSPQRVAEALATALDDTLPFSRVIICEERHGLTIRR
jgi:hypothetical protein